MRCTRFPRRTSNMSSTPPAAHPKTPIPPSNRPRAAEMNGSLDPFVTGFWVWGRWMNGGAWISVSGQRVDLIYRSIEHVERVIADAQAGKFELHYGQLPPFGYLSATYLGDLAICIPLVDPSGVVAALKRQVATYPEPLRCALVQAYLWASEFTLESFAAKFAKRGDRLGPAACLGRVAHQLVLVLFALNRRYLLSDKTALAEIASFPQAPSDFGTRISRVLARVGASPAELALSVDAVGERVVETLHLAGPLYHRPYPR